MKLTLIKRGLLAGLLLVLATFDSAARSGFSAPILFSPEYPDGSRYMNVRMRGSLRLFALHDGRPHQLSGLAWDADEGVLYALSDDAYVVHLKPYFTDDVLTKVDLQDIFSLHNAAGIKLVDRAADSEGLVALRTRNGLRGDTELVISFEVIPHIEHFQPNGVYLSTTPLPRPLAAPASYMGPNRQLEALTVDRIFGLITAPERPLKSAPNGNISLFSMSGMRWNYIPARRQYSALVGLETTADGDLLILERQFVSLLSPITTLLRRTTLTAAPDSLLAVKDIVRFDSSAGWAVDNFEGIARHQDDRYFMVSDDNNNALQKTLLIYFEILDDAPHHSTISVPTDAASAQPDCTGVCGNQAGAR
jgi:hypothetical protein